MFVRSYCFHVYHQYTSHIIITGGETTHRGCLVFISVPFVQNVNFFGTYHRSKIVDRVLARVDDIERVSNCTVIAAATAQIVLKS